MSVKKLIFDNLNSENDFYKQLVKQESLEEFGDNLDALWDFLTTDLEGPVDIVLKNSTSYISKLKKLKTLLDKAAKSRDDLNVIYE